MLTSHEARGGIADHLAWIRDQFPALKQTFNGQPVAFLDGPGGTQVPQTVIEAIACYLREANANAHGAFATSERTDQVVLAAHQAMADFLGCDRTEIVFGANMTSLTFAFSRAFGRSLMAGDEILVTALDHDANVAPWLALREQDVVVRTVEINPGDCTLDLADLAHKLNGRTRLLAVTWASNAVGTVTDLARIIPMAHRVGAQVFVDAVHYAAHGPIDVRALDCDFLACSPYKFFGPHIGVLYGKAEHLETLTPYKVRPAPETLPGRWETGTQNHEGLAGLVATVDYLAALGKRLSPAAISVSRRAAVVTAMNAMHQYGQQLCGPLLAGLSKMRGVSVYGFTDPEQMAWRVPTLALRLGDLPPRAIARALGEAGIFTWHGNFYALNLSQRLGTEEKGGFLRVGLVHYNSDEEVSRLLEALQLLLPQRTVFA